MGAILEVQVLPRAGHTGSEVKRNFVRVTEREKEAWSVNRESRTTKRIRGGTEQVERANIREGVVVKAR